MIKKTILFGGTFALAMSLGMICSTAEKIEYNYLTVCKAGTIEEKDEKLVESGKCSLGYLKYSVYDSNNDGVGNKIVLHGNGAMLDYSRGKTPWDSYRDNIDTLLLEEGITSISPQVQSYGRGTFEGMNFTNVELPRSLETIGDMAFTSCPKLTKVTVSNGTTYIGNNAFDNCTSLEEVSLGHTVQKIGANAFCGCDSLKSIVIPASVIELGNYAIGYKYRNNEKGLDLIEDFVIYGYEGSAAEEYAKSNRITFKLVETGFRSTDGRIFWFENNVKQGTYDDPKGVVGFGVVRGREIYDPVSDGWYWLDACFDGAKAVNKEVWMPYIYQDESKWSVTEIEVNAVNSADMKNQVINAIKEQAGKWVRYDADGKMIKGWYTVSGDDEKVYSDQIGNTYYYDYQTGLMAKGKVTIEGKDYSFDETTGALIK